MQETTRILKDSFYIDNSLTRLHSIQDTEKFIAESKTILASAHFNLRCWRSNLPPAMIDETEDKPKFAPVLGLVWNLEKYVLICKIEETIKISESFTKRKILSFTQKIFNPIGLTALVTLIPKLILQETCIQNLKWDEELRETLKKQFATWMRENKITQIKVPHSLNMHPENENKTSLHVFSDASKRAYTTCVYLRTQTPEWVKVQLINARSRVAPLKNSLCLNWSCSHALLGLDLQKLLCKTWSQNIWLPHSGVTHRQP